MKPSRLLGYCSIYNLFVNSMANRKLPKSLNKFIRREKARIRREILHPNDADRKVKELVEKIYGEYTKKGSAG